MEKMTAEQLAEEAYPKYLYNHNWSMLASAFIAGYNARDKEIERLKGLLEMMFVGNYCGKETMLEKEWQSYCAENNIQP